MPSQIFVKVVLPDEPEVNQMPIRSGATLDNLKNQLFDSPENYGVSVNRNSEADTYILEDGDKIVFYPKKVDGGC